MKEKILRLDGQAVRAAGENENGIQRYFLNVYSHDQHRLHQSVEWEEFAAARREKDLVAAVAFCVLLELCKKRRAAFV